MSKENFVNRVVNRIAEEYDVTPESLAHHRAKIEEAADTEAGITDEELDKLMNGTDATRAVNEKYPKLDAVSLAIVDELENQDLEESDEDDEDEDEDDEDEDEDEEDDDSDDEDGDD